jgi:hypothetical protein
MGGIFPRHRRDGDGCGDAAVPSDRRQRRLRRGPKRINVTALPLDLVRFKFSFQILNWNITSILKSMYPSEIEFGFYLVSSE